MFAYVNILSSLSKRPQILPLIILNPDARVRAKALRGGEYNKTYSEYDGLFVMK